MTRSVCRDRSMMFTKVIRQAAPQAQEAADRWHLLENLSSAVEKTCRQHRDCPRTHATRHLPPQPGGPARVPRTPSWNGSGNAIRTGRPGARAGRLAVAVAEAACVGLDQLNTDATDAG
ncbi:transposase [Streptomyces sp. NPDC086549]|uniref:transposase n=1 Tax=Streptomyces sp. NPDC086549 TaxID=3365752 RepID=UPI0037F71299